MTVIEGAGATGKSLLALDMAARVTRGMPWPGRLPGPEQAGDVLIVAGDPDDWERMIFPRLLRNRADLTRVARSNTINRYDPVAAAKKPKQAYSQRRFSLPDDLPMLEYRICELARTRLVIIDPLSAFCANDRAYRETLRQLDEIAARRNVAIVVVSRPPGRPTRNQLVADRRADTVRAVFHVVTDPEDDEQQWLAPVRMSFCAKPQWLPFRIGAAGIVWGEPVEAPPESILPASAARERRALRKGVMAWLKQLLEYHDMPATVATREAKKCGYSEATLRRAREELGVRSYRQGWGPWSVGWWTLKPEGEERPVLPPGMDGGNGEEDWVNPESGMEGEDAPAPTDKSQIRRAPDASPGGGSNGNRIPSRRRKPKTEPRNEARESAAGDASKSDLERFARAALTEYFAAGGMSDGPTEPRPVQNGHHRRNGHSSNGRHGSNGKPGANGEGPQPK